MHCTTIYSGPLKLFTRKIVFTILVYGDATAILCTRVGKLFRSQLVCIAILYILGPLSYTRKTVFTSTCLCRCYN